MKRYIKSLIFVCIAFMSFACTMLEEERLLVSESPEITITAMKEGLDAKLKTIRESDGSVEWCPMDEISVFYENGGNGGNKFTAQNTEQTDIAEFKGRIEGFIAGGENFTNGRYLYGVYPYSTNTSFNNGVTTISLPFNQTAVEGTFANGLFPTIARAKGVDLAFYNICGGIKFTVSKENIVSVKFRGNKKERLAGTAKVVFDSSEKPALLDESADAKEEIIVYAPAGGTFEVGKEYYIVSYPTELTSGYTLTFRTSDNKEGAYVSNDAVEIKRSIFGVLKDLDKNISSWTEAAYGGGGENSGVYLGIMGFNQQLYSFPMSHLNSQNKEGFDSFIDDLNMKYGTLLYYSVDQAINAMQTVPLPADLSTVAIVTFTDGLDEGSIMMNIPYSSSEEYLNAIGNRIKNEKVGGQPITAYSIGIKGDDVVDVTTFRNNISKLASSEENAIEVTSMSEVNAKFKEIAEQLSKSNYIQTVSLAMPGKDSGTVMRFTFDNVNSAEKSSLYIEGTFNKSTYTLENVKYEGLTSTSGTEIKGTADGIFVKFVFEGVQTADNKLINKDFIAEWYYIPSSNIWQVNSEFNKDEDSEIVTERSSAAIMLVLDCSSSLGSDFVRAQTNAKDFINTLYNAVGGDGDLEENPSQNDNYIYSTKPKDLSLSIWKGGTRYYLTKDEYSKANLSDAQIEGLTIIGGGESFVLSLQDVQSASISSIVMAKLLYGGIMPTEAQGKIISARRSDINAAISSFGGTQLQSSRYYYTSSTSSNYSYDYTYCIYGSGGNLYSTNNSPYVRGVKPTNHNSAIYWRDSNDLKLSVIINGNREFLDKQEYNERRSEIDEVEGVAVIAGGEKFAIHLNDAQSASISSIATAKLLYGGIMPTEAQGKTISAKRSDINAAISSFGGTPLSDSKYYYTSSTSSNYSYDYTYCIRVSGGNLYSTNNSPYVRGVTKIE